MPFPRVVSLAALAALTAAPVLAGHPLETIDVLCGGVANEDRERVAHEVRGATLELEFYAGTKGEYVAEVDVLFSPIDAEVAPFGIVTDGPVCRVELPPGKYRVYTWFNGNARSTLATIGKADGGLARITLGFPAERGNDAFLVPIADDKQARR